MSRKDPFPNDWEEVNNMDEDDFLTPPFHELLSDTMFWELPEPYCCIVRSYNRSTCKIKETAYRREGSANSLIRKLAEEGHEVTVLTPTAIAVLNYPEDEPPKRRQVRTK